MRRDIDTLIVDLDNTLFDWFDIWYFSFKPVYDKIVQCFDGDVKVAQSSIRAVNQKARTSEYSFLIEDLVSFQGMNVKGEVRDEFSTAMQESRAARDLKMRLYPTVLSSLWEIKKSGAKIVAYTESMGFYSGYRLKRLGLDGVIDVMFCPSDHDTPGGITINKLRSKPEDTYELQVTKTEHTPTGELKPNVKILKEIITSLGADANRCAYIGDSLFKDVAMARGAGVFDIYAKYGESQRRQEYSLLQDVSHWTEEDVQREAAITKNGVDFTPSATLNECFLEIFKHCDFKPFRNVKDAEAASTPQLEIDKINLDIWKKTVDVQQHFNDLELRIRNFAITIVGALIAAIGVMTQKELTASIYGFTFPTSISLIFAAVIVWWAFFLMDRYWYHVLLKGAVNHSIIISNSLKDRYPAITLGETISQESGNVRMLGLKMNSTRRLVAFYMSGFLMLTVVGLTLFFTASPIVVAGPPLPVPTEIIPVEGTLTPVP